MPREQTKTQKFDNLQKNTSLIWRISLVISYNDFSDEIVKLDYKPFDGREGSFRVLAAASCFEYFLSLPANHSVVKLYG